MRGEYLPLISVDRAFQWHDIDYGRSNYNAESEQFSGEQWEVVILQAAGRTIGLRVDELLGAQDIVVKSLSDNFMSIRGLSGASILGDGRVCLILDVGAIISQLVRATPAVKGFNNST